MAVVTGDRYIDLLVRFVDRNIGPLLDGSTVLKLNPAGLHYVHSRLDALRELEALISSAPVDYLRAYVSDLGDHRALEQLRRILKLLSSVKIVSVLPPPGRDPTPLSLLPFGRLKVLELRGCDLSTTQARGLLDLRHSLERLVCHNSTDALRHVFASRIVDIKDSPVWSRLSFVSCACNGLVLMDESLQLLPAIETLDLSRNKFAKVANLRKCTKLQHLDLGFNHLRTVTPLSEINCPIVKLGLRNNALSKLHGIEYLKEVEGIDLSYNIISNFSELEVLSSLSSLKKLWLEGNPVCCARWYRAHVFSFFCQPDKLELDGKSMNTREYWEMQAILSSNHKRPATYGFYFPAKSGAEEESSTSAKRKRHSRVACIDEEEVKLLSSEYTDQDTISNDGNHSRKEENIISDSEAEIMELMNRVKTMKEEKSVLWLCDLKDWLGTSTEGTSAKNNTVLNSSHTNEVWTRQENSPRCLDKDSANVISSKIEKSVNFIEDKGAACSHGDKCLVSNTKATLHRPVVVSNGGSENESNIGIGTKSQSTHSKQHESAACSYDPAHLSTLEATDSITSFETNVGNWVESKNKSMPSTVFENIVGSRSSSSSLVPPPQYKEDILHHCQNLEDEILQLSSESYSLGSSDSNSSCSDDSYRLDKCISELGITDEGITTNTNDYSSEIDKSREGHDGCIVGGNDIQHDTFQLAPASIGTRPDEVNFPIVNMTKNESDDPIDQMVNEEVSCNRENKWKPKKRSISFALLGLGITNDKDPLYPKSNGKLEAAEFG